MYADDAGRSRNLFAKMMFGLMVSEAKTENDSETEAVCQVYIQTMKVVYFGTTECQHTERTAVIFRRVLLASLPFTQKGFPLYEQPTALLRFKELMLKAEVVKTMPGGGVTWSATVAHLVILRTAHHGLLLRCVG